MEKKHIWSLLAIIVITSMMIYQVIVREHWSLKVSALFVVIFGLVVIVNVIRIMNDEIRNR